jgi:hypothetical protein
LLNNIRVVLISVESFNIEGLLAVGLKSLGAEVLRFNERPDNKTLTKATIRFNKELVANKLQKHYDWILSQTLAFKPSFIFVLRGETVSKLFLNSVKRSLPKCKLIFYNSDSFKNNPNPEELIPLFDSVFTFDREDSIRLGIRYLPLFYEDSYIQSQVSKDLTFSFIGTIHTDRLRVVESVKSQIDPKRSFLHYYSHGLLHLLFQFLTSVKIPVRSIPNIKFNTINPEDVENIFKRTEIVVDIQHPGQSGLTMRTIQALGAGCKLITTNEHIVHHDFYNSTNIFIIDRRDPKISQEFISKPYQSIDPKILKKYTLTNWLRTIFDLEK